MNPDRWSDSELCFTSRLMNASQIASNPLHLIDIIRFKLAATQTGEYGVVKPFMREQRLVIELYRRGNGNVINQQIVSKLVLL